jgi:hypothetical protein
MRLRLLQRIAEQSVDCIPGAATPRKGEPITPNLVNLRFPSPLPLRKLFNVVFLLRKTA